MNNKYKNNPTLEKYKLMHDYNKGKIKNKDVGKKILEIDNKHRTLFEKVLIFIFGY